MTTFVTGGLGFIGSNFVFSHLKEYPSERVVIIDNYSYSSNTKNVTGLYEDYRVDIKNCDIRNFFTLSRLYDEYKPKITYHFAAETHVDNSIVGDDTFISTNVIGTHNVLKCIRANDSRLVHVSTDEVYGSLALDGFDKFTENTPYNPQNPYSATKAASDHLVRSYVNTHDIDAVVTNCSNNYGPRQHREKFIPTIIRHIKNNTPVPVYGNGLNVRDWIYVEDHCEALLKVGANAKRGSRYNIGGNCELSNIEMVTDILNLIGKPVNMYQNWINFVTDRKGHDLRYSMDSGKMFRELGWKPKTSLTDGLLKTLEWYYRA
jgi:dTDP-glucose 4,6-dehydratase